jgi:capsular polysaccharide transport system permease protein
VTGFSRKSSLFEGWRVQRRSLHALMVRDMMMRYGRENVGFVWIVLEPMILSVGVMAIWTAMGVDKAGVKAVEMVLTGYLPLTLWRHLTNTMVNLFRNSAGMLYHRRVTALDLVLSRQFLEVISTTTALLVVYSTLRVVGLVQSIDRLDLFLLGWLMMAWISMAFGMWLAVFTEKHEVAERFVQPMQYLNIPISGAFFFVDWLPSWAQKIILFHPLVHGYEMFRAGYFGNSMVTHYNLPYFVAVTFVLTFIAFRSVQKVSKHVRLN